MSDSIILMPNWMGDYLLALSVIENSAPAFQSPPALLTPSWLMPLAHQLTRLPLVNYDRSSVSRRREVQAVVRAGKFGKIFLLPYSFSSAWFAFRTGIPSRRGIGRDGRGILLTERLANSTRNYTRHITREYAAVLDVSPVPPAQWKGRKIAGNEQYRGYAVMCPGATFGQAKRWPYFDKLLHFMDSERAVLLGKTGDAEGLEHAVRGRGKTVDLTGKTTLPEAAAIIAAASIVIANDSGLMHLAGFLGTPVAGIFGSTSPDWTRPLGKNAGIIYKSEQCSPCFSRTCRYGHYNCLRTITAEQVNAYCAEAAP